MICESCQKKTSINWGDAYHTYCKDCCENPRPSIVDPENVVQQSEVPAPKKVGPVLSLIYRYPIIFGLLAFAVLIDISGIANFATLGSSYALGSFLAVFFFLSVSLALRFAIFRRPVHWIVAGITILILYVSWFVLKVALSQESQGASILFLLCIIAAFRILRYKVIDELTS